MGLFLSASAIRHCPPSAVEQTIRDYAARYGVETRTVDRDMGEEENSVSIYAADRDWTTLSWASDLIGHDVAACRHLSRSFKTLVSHASIYDGDFWSHFLFANGQLVDQFRSDPTYFLAATEQIDKTMQQWRGNAEAIARTVGVPADQISPYMEHPRAQRSAPPEGGTRALAHRLARTSRQETRRAPGKAHPDDTFERDDPWVFVDFWRRLGITYPHDQELPVYCLEFAAPLDGLPVEDI